MDATTFAERELSPIGLALLGQKRKFEPEGEKEDNEQTNPRRKRAKSEELPSIRGKKLKPRRKGLAVTKGLPSVKEDEEEMEVEPKREGLAMTMQLRSSKRATSLPPTLEGCSSFVPHSASVLGTTHAKPLSSIKEDEVREVRLARKGSAVTKPKEDEVREVRLARKGSAVTKPLPSIEEDEVKEGRPVRAGSAITKNLRSSTKRTIRTRSKSASPNI